MRKQLSLRQISNRASTKPLSLMGRVAALELFAIAWVELEEATISHDETREEMARASLLSLASIIRAYTPCKLPADEEVSDESE